MGIEKDKNTALHHVTSAPSIYNAAQSASVASIAKPKFRARKLEHNRPLKVFRASDMNDDEIFEDMETRAALPQISTGVDKEEEVEVHLQTALTAAQLGSERVYIPTPSANVQVEDYETIYALGGNKKELLPFPGAHPKEYVRTVIQQLNARTSLIPKYEAGTMAWAGDDHSFLSKNPAFSPLLLEQIFDCFEESAARFSPGIVSVESLERLREQQGQKLPPEADLEKVVEYWKEKRYRAGVPLVTCLKYDDSPDAPIGSDPYVCFRRRMLRNLQRKTRRSDAQIADKIKRLHFDMITFCQAIKANIKRDLASRESIRLEARLFDIYVEIEEGKADGRIDASSVALLPPFRLVGQPIEAHVQPLRLSASTVKKQKSSASSSGTKKKRPAAPVEEETAKEQEQTTNSRLSLPANADKHSKWVKPHYPSDAVRAIQKDIEALMSSDLACSLPQCQQIEGLSEEQQSLIGLLGMFGCDRPERMFEGVPRPIQRKRLRGKYICKGEHGRKVASAAGPGRGGLSGGHAKGAGLWAP